MKGQLYVIDSCDLCERAKIHLRSVNVEFEVVNVMDEPKAVMEVQKYIGEIVVPVFVINQRVFVKETIFTYLG